MWRAQKKWVQQKLLLGNKNGANKTLTQEVCDLRKGYFVDSQEVVVK